MNREEAVALCREIANLCKDMDVRAVELMESKRDDTLAQGFQIKIKAFVDSENLKQIEEAAMRNRVAMKEENGEVVVFKPKELEKQIILTL